MAWTQLNFGNNEFHITTKLLPTKGNLVYEYNPLRNYRLSKTMYEYKGNLYSLGELCSRFDVFPKLKDNTSYIIIKYTENNINKYKLATKCENEKGETQITDLKQYIIDAYDKKRNAEINNIHILLTDTSFEWNNTDSNSNPVLHESGELVDFITDELKVSLDHPIQMIPQYSYDGSVNLIINDGITIPKLVNTRFSATGKNTYEIVDRKGNNDSNIYDLGDNFESDVSLYKRISNIAKIKFEGIHSGGSLSVGNYHFYFKLADSDGNESDFIGESGLVSVFIGQNHYSSVNTGLKNQNSFKQVHFSISNVDTSYDYIVVYYSRSTAEQSFNSITEYCKIDKKFLIQNLNYCNIIITGSEHVTPVSITEINPIYNVIDAAKTSAVCQNRLFLGNVHKCNIPYEELADLSLRFLPYLKQEIYDVQLDQNYSVRGSTNGYIDPEFIYNKTGYWEEELYRLGIVYILQNDLLSPVFNIRGACNITSYDDNSNGYSTYAVYDDQMNRNYISYDEKTNYLISENENTDKFLYENNKGVIRLKRKSIDPDQQDDLINSLDIRVDNDTINEIKKYAKGYFFVRQPRIPLVLAQGLTVGIDETSRTPTLPINSTGVLTNSDSNLENSYLNINSPDQSVKYVSEGFLTRYLFKLKEDERLPLTAKIALGVLAVAALVVATVFTCGAAGALATGAALSIGAATSAGAGALVAGGIASALSITGMAGAGIIGLSALIEHGVISLNHTDGYNLNGINTEIPKGFLVEELDDSRLLINESYYERLIVEDADLNKIQGILCPEYTVNQLHYNQIFTGNKHLIKSAIRLNKNKFYGTNCLEFDYRHFYINEYENVSNTKQGDFKIIGIPEGSKAIGLSNLIFKAKAGEAEEAWRFEKVGRQYPDASDLFNVNKINSDIIRGIFSSYLAFDDTNNLFQPAEIVNIYIPGYSESKLELYINIRMDDVSNYSAISDRISLTDIDEYSVNPVSGIMGEINNSGYKFNVYRGDCYICQFTQRLIRNFNDPSAPYNDKIVDSKTWKENYDTDATEKFVDINLGDVNAVQLGMWVTFKLRSSYNLNIRTLDGSDVNESAASGHERGFYPYYPISTNGSYKIPESSIHNKGFIKYLSDRFNVLEPNVPYIKNWFGTRIMYSNIQVNDAFKNGFRVFQGSNYRDYTREYGEIVKLISLQSLLLVVFEHGIGLLNVNSQPNQSTLVYINNNNVLSEDITILSDSIGSQWSDSILKVSGKSGQQYIYGVDTVAKKIWRTNGTSVDCISDMKVQEFLNNNITLSERELTPKLGIRNVKTVYNAYKHDVMFTFYDNTYGFEEKVWNLCWNELLECFVTFYSWVPSFMENINNIPFSFNRDTSKWIAKLGTSHTQNSLADGITLSNVIINNTHNTRGIIDETTFLFTYINKENKECILYGKLLTNSARFKYMKNCIGVLSLNNRNLPSNELPYYITYSLEHDNYKNYELFEILPISFESSQPESLDVVNINDEKSPYYRNYYKSYTVINNQKLLNAKYTSGTTTLYGLFLKPDVKPENLLSELYYRNRLGNSYADDKINKINCIEYDSEGNPKYLNDKIEYKIDNDEYTKVCTDLPIFKDLTGKRLMLPKNQQLNPDKIVRLLNIKATINIIAESSNNLSDDYYNSKAGFAPGSTLIDAGTYESTVAVIPKWNMQFLSTDFWKHGQAGIIDIADDIYPTYWYGKQHPFEFECVVSGDPGVHKIFTNLELIANKAKPESFHYEIIGEAYDFAKDKKNMYFRQEAIKALWLYNGADISYNRNFLKIQPEKQTKSADFPHIYYNRQDTINEIEDSYVGITTSGYDYRHLSGSEIVYYPTRQEYRIWTHARAVTLDELDQEDSRSIIAANCNYTEDKWRVTINPILVYYKNESDWNKDSNNKVKPKLPIMNSPIPDDAYKTIVLNKDLVKIPPELANYSTSDFDLENWGDDDKIYNTSFGEAQNRREVDIKDKFIKIRVRYSGEELAIIDFLNTIYKISYA